MSVFKSHWHKARTVDDNTKYRYWRIKGETIRNEMNRLWKSTTETVIVRFLIASLNLAFQKHKFTEILHKNNNFLSF